MNLCTLLRKFNRQEVDIPKKERVAVNALQYYEEKKVQISGPPPVVSHTLMHIPNHEILTILAEVKISPPQPPSFQNFRRSLCSMRKK